jgi:hypothetical protein
MDAARFETTLIDEDRWEPSRIYAAIGLRFTGVGFHASHLPLDLAKLFKDSHNKAAGPVTGNKAAVLLPDQPAVIDRHGDAGDVD